MSEQRDPSIDVVPYVPFHPACRLHRSLRPNDAQLPIDATERPQRLSDVYLGIAALYSRLEEASRPRLRKGPLRVEILSKRATPGTVHRGVVTEIFSDQEVKSTWEEYWHPLLQKLCKHSQVNLNERGSELPPGSDTQHLYLCPTSLKAFEAALQCVFSAISAVTSTQSPDATLSCIRAFAPVRPPGNNSAQYLGIEGRLGWFNNMSAAVSYAYHQEYYRYFIVLDIDIHFGHGTSIAMDRHRTGEGGYDKKTIFYANLYDPHLYPTGAETYDEWREAFPAARDWSVHEHDVPLSDFKDSDSFWRNYDSKYVSLLKTAEDWCQKINALPEKTIVLMSIGFGASEHESTHVRRPGVFVPTDFFHRFTLDACKLADRVAQGRIVSILEGGMNQRALVSGTMAHLGAMAEAGGSNVDCGWWDSGRLEELERDSGPDTPPWVLRTQRIYESLQSDHTQPRNKKSTFDWLPPTDENRVFVINVDMESQADFEMKVSALESLVTEAYSLPCATRDLIRLIRPIKGCVALLKSSEERTHQDTLAFRTLGKTLLPLIAKAIGDLPLEHRERMNEALRRIVDNGR